VRDAGGGVRGGGNSGRGAAGSLPGLLAKTGDSRNCARRCWSWWGTMRSGRKCRRTARRIALAEYDLSVQTRRYVELYTEMLGPGAGRVGKGAAVQSAAARCGGNQIPAVEFGMFRGAP